MIIDTNPLSDNSSRSIVIIDDKHKGETLKYDINRGAVKIPALSSRKIDKYEFLTRDEVLPFEF